MRLLGNRWFPLALATSVALVLWALAGLSDSLCKRLSWPLSFS